MARKTRTAHRIRQIEEAFTRRIAIYLRRSTDEDNQPYSLEAQETKLRAFVESQPGDWQIVMVYSDDASGATTDREELQKMLRAARAGLFDTVLVYRVDRFSRSLRDLVGLLDDQFVGVDRPARGAPALDFFDHGGLGLLFAPLVEFEIDPVHGH